MYLFRNTSYFLFKTLKRWYTLKIWNSNKRREKNFCFVLNTYCVIAIRGFVLSRLRRKGIFRFGRFKVYTQQWKNCRRLLNNNNVYGDVTSSRRRAYLPTHPFFIGFVLFGIRRRVFIVLKNSTNENFLLLWYFVKWNRLVEYCLRNWSIVTIRIFVAWQCGGGMIRGDIFGSFELFFLHLLVDSCIRTRVMDSYMVNVSLYTVSSHVCSFSFFILSSSAVSKWSMRIR